MEVKFNNIIYIKNGRNGKSLKNLCFDIFTYYLKLNANLKYDELQSIFNDMHCNNNFVLLNRPDWSQKTKNLQGRYFDPINYNSDELFFTTQWGSNGGTCDNINKMIAFAIKEKYPISILSGDSENKTKKTDSIKTKNIMLYGAPGVGKTHNYKKLLSQIEEGKSEKDIFKSIFDNENVTNEYDDTFEKIKDEKRIEFVTFHQSYSYEDFIEGFRPDEDTKSIIRKDGIFKIIADSARQNLDDSKKEAIEIKQQSNLVRSFENYIDYKIDHNETVNLKKGDEFNLIKFENKRLYFETTDKATYSKEFTLSYDDFELIYNSLLPKNTLRDISQILKTHSVPQRYAYFLAIYNDFIKKKQSITIEDNIEYRVKRKNFYIVIDEINRGNISKIFAELITLIEEVKRYDGNKTDYEVTLPYSKEKFKIPSNLYIIATMNSTDKSIATIDIALRRRFTFLKMEPKSDLVKYPNAKQLMDDLNNYIEDNLGEDYKLGHSYFMKLENDEELEFVKEYKIKPLLEEYFYSDEKKYNEALSILNKKEEKIEEITSNE
jgi:5-methylcytosine-specific restriction enzyme B